MFGLRHRSRSLHEEMAAFAGLVYSYWKMFRHGMRCEWFPGEPLSAEILRVHPDEPEPDRVKYIVSCLRAGSVIGMPTDTFYGLAVDPVNLHAVERFTRSRAG